VVGEHAGLSLSWPARALATPAGGAEVPDPYGGGAEGFERVLDLIELGADEWVERIGALLASADDDTKAPPGGSGT
jgi:protein-tyrosine-phosphatase